MRTDKRLAVTGGNGLLGRKLVPRLIEAGYDVTSMGLEQWANAPCEHVVCDLRNFGDAIEVFSGRDFSAIVHLAAHSGYVTTTDVRTFHDNVILTFNTLLAARDARVKRVIWSSSSHTVGQPFDREHGVSRVPVREDDQYSMADVYGLSKKACESLMGHRRLWGDLQIVALRVSFVYEERDYPFTYAEDGQARSLWPHLVSDIRETPEERLSNLWGYVDGRDWFQSVQRAVESEAALFDEIFFITAEDTIVDIPSRELVERYMPKATVDEELSEFGSFYSIERARSVLGYSPEYSWRQAVLPVAAA